MNEMISEIIVTYNNYLKKLTDGCNSITDIIASENPANVLQLIIEFSEGLHWLMQVNEKLTMLGYENPIQAEKIHEVLEEINKGLEIQDFILVGDIFEYELKQFFANCKPYKIIQEN